MTKPSKQKIPKPPQLPSLLHSKIYKTGQTRGADDDVIYQNRVSRTSTVLIPYVLWDQISSASENTIFEGGFIALISPSYYFNTPNITLALASHGLVIGQNALVFYQTRSEWIANNPEQQGWTAAQSRKNPLGGQYVARISATTALNHGDKIIQGFNTTASKGAGIRLFEYADAQTVSACRIQLEALFWLCRDALEVACQNGMTHDDAKTRSAYALEQGEAATLLDMKILRNARIVNIEGKTICPLCLEELSGQGFFNRMAQAEGREIHDLTVTQLNLFHISELRFGSYNHRPYNLGWGHHHCNMVVKDAGIMETLEWMHTVIQRNINDGHFTPANNPI